MKNYILRTVDNECNIINESNLTLKEGSILIQTICVDHASQNQLLKAHEWLKESLEKDPKLITVTKDVKFSILEKI